MSFEVAKLMNQAMQEGRFFIVGMIADQMTDEQFAESTKTWSDSAREAAIAARRARGEGRVAKNFNEVYSGGKFNKDSYKNLSSRDREGVLRHMLSQHKENYAPIASTEGRSGAWVAQNKVVGQFEGMRRAMIKRANQNKGKDSRKLLQFAIALQGKAVKSAADRDKQ